MYSKQIVEERLSFAQAELGWTPEYHSATEVDKFTEYLRRWEKYNAAGQLYFSRDLTAAEHRFIVNETTLCVCDAAYYLTRYAHVADENDTNVRFKFRDTQKIYFHVISDLEAKGAAIEIIGGKSRQQFFTTIVELLIGHRVFFYKDTNALTASADRIKSEEMGKKILFAYDNLQWWIRPKYSRRVESVPGLLEFETLNSRVSIQHGATSAKQKGQQRVGLGRGGTRTVWHVSEAAHIPRPEEQIEASLMRATHASPKVFGNIESSFAGKTGWFADKYRYAKEHRNDGLSRLTPIFFSWPCAHDIYPTRTWIATHPVPFEWQPRDKVLSQIIKAELFIRNDPLLGDYFGTDWVMPIDQQWFYHCLYTEALGSGNMNSLMQEMACDDVEAMIASYDNVFGQETIEVCHANRVQKYDVYGIVGQSIETEHEPAIADIDISKPRVPIIHTSNQGDTYKWELVPLKYELFENPSGRTEELEYINDVLFVFKQPSFRKPLDVNTVTSRRFSAGIDTGTGQGYDYSCICVTERGDGPIPDVQVAEWRSNKVGHVEVFAFALPICLYFTNPDKEIQSYPLVGIEQLTAVGDVCQKEMKRLGYPAGRFFNFGRYDSRNKLKQLTNKQGWFTTGWSRPILVGNFIYVVQNGWYTLNSPWTIEECREFEIHRTSTGKVKEEHSSASHDDSIFAAGISTFILHDMDTLADRSKKQSRVGELKPKLILTPNEGMSMNINAGGVKEATLAEILELSN